MSRRWVPGQRLPEAALTVTFTWNEVAVQRMLDALKDEYPSGYSSMCDHVADAVEAMPMPPKPEEPQGLGAVVEDAEGRVWVRVEPSSGSAISIYAWRHRAPHGEVLTLQWADISAVRVLSAGWSA